MSLVVVIDANDVARGFAAEHLQAAGYVVAEAADGTDGLRRVFELRPAAVVLDLAIPKMDGLELTRIIRTASDIPIIVLGQHQRPEAIIRVLDMGADDFIDKPFSGPELVARVRAAVRRAARERDRAGLDPVVQVGDITIDREAQVVTKGGDVVKLTATEYRLLEALAVHVGKVAPHRFLLSTVWGDEYVDDMHYLRIYVGYLRKKLEDDPRNPTYLINEWGTGYRLAAVPPS